MSSLMDHAVAGKGWQWLLAGLLLCAGIVSAASAQTYPVRPIRLVIPFPPGGSNDIVGRVLAAQLTERLGKQVVVDNRPRAGGSIGTDPGRFGSFIVSEIAKWGGPVKQIGVKAE